jgi:hypothetical protein
MGRGHRRASGHAARARRPSARTGIGYPYGQAFALSPNGQRLLVGTIGGAVVLLDIATGRVLARHTLRLSSQIWSADFAQTAAWSRWAAATACTPWCGLVHASLLAGRVDASAGVWPRKYAATALPCRAGL